MRIFSCTLALILITSCSTQKALIGDNFNISMDKGSCFGSCPVYTLSIDNKGYATFEGERFTDKVGKHGLQLQSQKLDEIATAFSSADLASYDDNYPSDISDLPITTIAYINNTFQKRISGKVERPEKIKELQSMLEDIAQMDGWMSLDTAAVEMVKPTPKEEAIIKNEIIIKFKSGTFISKWLKQYKEYSLYVKKPLDDTRTTWVTQFNDRSIDPYELLQLLKEQPEVESAEFNKKVTKR